MTTPADAPPSRSTVEITVTEREVIWPFVVRLLAAQRRLVSVCSDTITMQPSVVDRLSAASTICWGLLIGRPPSGC